jgi:hypothetical protein
MAGRNHHFVVIAVQRPTQWWLRADHLRRASMFGQKRDVRGVPYLAGQICISPNDTGAPRWVERAEIPGFCEREEDQARAKCTLRATDDSGDGQMRRSI